MTTFQIGDVVAANIEGVFFTKHATAEVLTVNDTRVMTVRFNSGVKGDVRRDQLVSIENFRLIPTVQFS